MLAIGLVVDDAIVVVEGVERHIEEGLTPKNAAFKAMEELSGPVVGIALVLSAVFVPTQASFPELRVGSISSSRSPLPSLSFSPRVQRAYPQPRTFRAASTPTGTQPRPAEKILRLV